MIHTTGIGHYLCRHLSYRLQSFQVIIMATRTQNVLGERGRRIRELTSVVQKRFGFPESTVEVLCRILSTNYMLYVSFIFSCTPRRCRSAVFAPSPSANRSATSSSVASPSAGMYFCRSFCLLALFIESLLLKDAFVYILCVKISKIG